MREPTESTRWKNLSRSLLLLLAVIGPGIITGNVDNDAGGIYTFSVAGASFGYSLLWTLIPITVSLIIVQEIAARMGVVTGKGLADLIREEYGLRITFFLMICLLVADFGNTMSEFAGIASGMSLFGVSRFIVVPLGAILVWVLVVKGTYSFVEKVFLVGCLFYIAYPVSCFLARPVWGEALKSTVVPSFHFSRNYIYVVVGLIGTNITPWMQFYLQSAVVEKGVKIKDWIYSRWDIIIGCLITNLVTFFIIVACGATIFLSGHHEIRDAADAALALKPLAGRAASALFALGLVNASLLSASILPLATAYYVCEGLGLESGIDKRFEEAPTFYWLYTALIVLGAMAVMVLRESMQIPIILLSQVVNGVMLPFVLIFMLRLSNREDLMGSYKNGRGFNIVAWATCIIMIVLTLMLIGFSFTHTGG